jgi:predicted permease
MSILLSRLASLLRNSFRRRRVESDLSDEVGAWVQIAADERMQRGMTAAQARRAALVELGGAEQVKEEVRAIRAGALLEQFWQDVRFGLRTLAKNPGFAATAVLTISLGIGINAGIFSIIESATMRPLDLPGANRLIGVYQVFHGRISREVHGSPTMFSYPEYLQYREQSHVFSGLVAYAPFIDATLGSYEQPLMGSLVTCNYFDVLQAKIALGRGFTAAECDVDNSGAVVVLSDRLWHSAYNADPAILGKTINLNRQPLTVVGVASPRFQGTEPILTDFWAPVTMERAIMGTGSGETLIRKANLGWLIILGRLQDGVSLNEAQADLGVTAAQIDQQYRGRVTKILVSVASLFGEPERKTIATSISLVVLIAVGMVLLIACANVANLMLARSMRRRKEIAIRLSVGARRGRVVRQLLTESFLIAALGGALGVVLAAWTSGAALKIILSHLPPGAPPLVLSVKPDARLFLYALAITVVTAIAFGLAPALQATRADVNRELKQEPGNYDRRSGSRNRLRNTLLAVQVCVCMVLLTGAGLLLRGLYRAQTVNIGFDQNHTALVSFDLVSAGYDAGRAAVFQRNARERLLALPGVDAVAAAITTPLSGGRHQEPFTAEGQPEPTVSIDFNAVTPDYFSIVGIPIVRGRTFLESEMGGATAAIVSESAARRYWPGEDPLGKRIRGLGEKSYAEVVGVAKDTDVVRPGSAEIPVLYVPVQPRDSLHARLLVHTTAGFTAIAKPIPGALHANDPELLVNVNRLEDNLQNFIAPSQIAAGLAATLGGLGLLLATIGIYGTVSYLVGRRTREIGIRMTLGARSRDVLLMVLRDSMRPVLIGAAIGLVAGAGVSQLIRVLLWGVSPLDAISFASVSLFFLGVTMLASYLPARKALRIEPMAALRHE